MATYEEILNRKITHEYLKKYDDGDDLTKYNTFKKFLDLYVKRATYIFFTNERIIIDMVSTTKLNKLIIVLNDQLALDDVKPYIKKIEEDYFSNMISKFF